MKDRIKKKLTGKTSWYKQKKRKSEKRNQEEENKFAHASSSTRRSGNTQRLESTATNTTPLSNKGDKELKTSAVLFVENTKDGALARRLREVVERIQFIMGFRIKIVERAGTPLKLMFPLSRIGQGGECGRADCVTCTQESRGDVSPPVTKGVSFMRMYV